MNYSKEIIWHFICHFCKDWWSIAASEDVVFKNLYCPHCGKNQNSLTELTKDI